MGTSPLPLRDSYNKTIYQNQNKSNFPVGNQIMNITMGDKSMIPKPMLGLARLNNGGIVHQLQPANGLTVPLSNQIPNSQ